MGSGTQVARFDPDLADRRQTWDGCPTGTMTYEGRDCPVSPLRTIGFLSRDGGALAQLLPPFRLGLGGPLVERNGSLVVNPGSAGAARFGIPPSVGILTLDGGQESVELIELPQ